MYWEEAAAPPPRREIHSDRDFSSNSVATEREEGVDEAARDRAARTSVDRRVSNSSRDVSFGTLCSTVLMPLLLHDACYYYSDKSNPPKLQTNHDKIL